MQLDIAGVFGAGVLTFLTPCILPLVPVYIAAITGEDINSLDKVPGRRIVFRAAVFCLGFIIIFSIMGLGASAVGSSLDTHRIFLKAAGGIVIVFFGLKFLGIIRIRLLDAVFRIDEDRLRRRSGILNALIMGTVFALGWSPCVGPVLASVLAYTASQTSNPIQGAGYLAVYGLGLALPLMLISIMADAGIGLVRKLGGLGPGIERITGVLLIIVGLSMILEAYA